MINLLFVLVLLALSNETANAEWIFLTTDGKGNTVYFDPDTVIRKGTHRKISVLLDAMTVQETIDGRAFKSSRAVHEYDCSKERFRFLAFALFSDNMGSGQPVSTNYTIFDWELVPPKGSVRRLLELVCNR